MSASIAGIKRSVLRGAAQQGLSFRPDALKRAVAFAREQLDEGWGTPETLSELLIQAAGARGQTAGGGGGGSTVLDAGAVERAIGYVLDKRSGRGGHDALFECINIFDVPRYTFDGLKKAFAARAPGADHNVDGKTEMLRTRFELLHQRLQRDPKFQLISDEFSTPLDSANAIAVTPIGALLGSEGPKCVFGMLSKHERVQLDGQGNAAPVYYLEDLDAKCKLELTADTKSGGGLITEGCCVFAEGVFRDGVFVVSAFAHPPAEPHDVTKDFLAGVNLFGGTDTRKFVAHDSEGVLLEDIEAELSRIFVVLSDVHLDSPTVMEKLRVLLGGYAQMDPPPACFVLMGNFFSTPPGNAGGTDRGLASHCFAQLGSLIQEFPALAEETQFVLVPGPTDPGPCPGLVPRPPLPRCFTADLVEALPTVHLASNPCRLHFCGQQLVFYREDLMHKMRRSLVVPADVSPPELCYHHHLAKSVLDQATLCPLPATARPVHWQYDHALHLYPQPHLAVLADRAARYDVEPIEADGCACLNPGSFFVDFGFSCYTPLTHSIEPCQLP